MPIYRLKFERTDVTEITIGAKDGGAAVKRARELLEDQGVEWTLMGVEEAREGFAWDGTEAVTTLERRGDGWYKDGQKVDGVPVSGLEFFDVMLGEGAAMVPGSRVVFYGVKVEKGD